MKIAFRNPKTGELKEVKVGWSWTLFLFSGMFGLPLFLRRLYVWGFIFLVLWVVSLALPPIGVGLGVICLGLQIWLGIKGNEMTAKNYLEQGWTFAESGSEAVKFAKGKWGIVIDNIGQSVIAT